MLIVVALGLGSAIVYGASDFLGAVAARRLHLVTATAFNYGIATLVILVALFILGGVWSSAAIWAGVITGVLAVIGLLAFYGVLAVGPMSLLSPVIALIQSIVPVTFAVIAGQQLNALDWIAIVVAIVAILLLAPPPRRGGEHISRKGALLAVFSGLMLGASLVSLDFAPTDSGVIPAVWEIGTGFVLLVIAWLVVRAVGHGRLTFLEAAGDTTTPVRRAWLAAGASGLLTAIADAFIVYGLHLGSLAIISVLVALYPVVTVILARFVLKERMTPVQFVAVGLVIAASLLFSAA
jgi:drug/metabolite transporter (DMT)-like permease